MKRILYFLYVDWKWIKQRPHFIAEGLAESFVVDAIHEILYNFQKQKRDKNEIENLNIKGMPHIPLCRYDFIFNINSFLVNKLLLRNKLKKADIVWFGHPFHYNKFRARKGQVVVYDCMDDILAFTLPERTKRRFEKLESKLCREADLVFASSLNLKDKLKERYGRDDVLIVNNAISLSLDKDVELPKHICRFFDSSSNTKKIVYIGTISDWFDFDAIKELLAEYKNLELLLFGPNDVEIPQCERIRHCGILEHKYLLKVMHMSDALIMPFVLNDLIFSVDPVKAYEYIYSGKPVIMPRYGESEKFDDYAHLYTGKEGLRELFEQLHLGTLKAKRNELDCMEYAKGNSWNNRVGEIRKYLEESCSSVKK